MSFSVSAFKAGGLPDGGFRPTLFEVTVPRATQRFSLTCQTSQVPGMTTGVIEVPYFGRKIKIAGDRTFAEWTTTAMLEESFTARREIEEWARQINDGPSNVRSELNEQYKEEVDVVLFKKDGSPAITYKLVGCWPSDVGAIELDWGTNDTVGTYTVTWAFDYMQPGN